MKRKELNLAIILVLFLLLSNIYSYIQYKEISEVQSFLYELKKDSDIKIGQLEALKECRANEILLNGNEISRDWEITNLQGGRETLSDIMSDNTLVLRYSEMHCDVCIDSIVSKLNIYQDSIGLQNIVLFTSTKNMNYVKKFKRVNNIHFDIGMPYLFVYSFVDERINNVFVPQKENVKFTYEYLHSILLKYYTK
mgnify:CR=1 FL=1